MIWSKDKHFALYVVKMIIRACEQRNSKSTFQKPVCIPLRFEKLNFIIGNAVQQLLNKFVVIQFLSYTHKEVSICRTK